jgi:secondary thiamine-phosphate synthase enzyme
MIVKTTQFDLDTCGNFSVVNITEQVRDFVRESGVHEGQALVYYKHTTGAIVIGEHEAGIIADWQAMFEQISPINGHYHHHLKAVDFNAHAHLRSALLTVSVAIPVVGGDLALGTYQDILVIDDQSDPANRRVIVQVMGI